MSPVCLEDLHTGNTATDCIFLMISDSGEGACCAAYYYQLSDAQTMVVAQHTKLIDALLLSATITA